MTAAAKPPFRRWAACAVVGAAWALAAGAQAQPAVLTGTITGPGVAVGTGAGTPAASVTGIGSVSAEAARAAAASGAAGPAGTAAAAGVPGGVQIVNPAPPGGAAPGTPTAAAAAAAANTGASAGARYVEACQQALERGAVNPGCQGPLYASEIARLKDEALKSQNASLLTLLGDAYQSNRSGISDVGQAYRWYLLAAVRGDPRAMQRLSDLYRNGRGAPQDNVRALGYARLAQKLALPGSPGAQQSAEAIQSLGQDMASEELVLADRFAGELEQNLRGAGAAGTAAPATPAAVPAAQPGAPLTGRLPGLGSARAGAAATPVTPVPAPSGVPALPGAATAP